MIQEMLRYLNVAENMLWHIDPYQNSDMYNTVLHALVKSKDVCTSLLFISSLWCLFFVYIYFTYESIIVG